MAGRSLELVQADGKAIDLDVFWLQIAARSRPLIPELRLYKLLNMRRDNFKHYYRFRAVQSFVALGLQGVWGGTGYCKPTA